MPKRTSGAARDPLAHDVPMCSWTVLAQDTAILGPGGTALTTTVSIPAQRIERGPKLICDFRQEPSAMNKRQIEMRIFNAI